MRTYLIISLSALSLFAGSCKKDDQPVLTEQEKSDLLFLREEEKLARDIYDYCYDVYGVSIFDHISSSEQSHMDQVLTLLNYYNLTDPVTGLNAGEFKDQNLQQVYNEFIQKASVSQNEALQVGATIEDMDIIDIRNFAGHTTKIDILDVYSVLQCGSRNHLRAFTSQITSAGESYTPQYLSEEEYQSIISSDKESCSSN